MQSDDLADRMAELARDLRSQVSADHTMNHIVDAAVDLVGPCEHAGITIAHRDGRIESPAATGELPVRSDELQQECGEGPCVDAAWDQPLVRIPDLVNDERWPKWGPRAGQDLGVGSLLCVQLFTHEHQMGALNLFASEPDQFGLSAEAEALAIAAHAAVAVAAAQSIDQLQVGLARRTVTGQATGILMERYCLDSQQAFEVLRRTSSQTNRKIYHICADLVDHRKVDGL
jgi:GAF domain-containing protein